MTLNQIVDDILLTVSYVDREKRAKIERRQVESWIHQYRLLLLKQEVSKNSVVDPSYISYHRFSFVGEELFYQFEKWKDPAKHESGTNIFSQHISDDGSHKYFSEESVPELAPLIGRIAVQSFVIYNELKYDSDGNPDPKNIPAVQVPVVDMARSFYGHYSKWTGDRMIASVYNKIFVVYKFGEPITKVDDVNDPYAFYAYVGLILATPETATGSTIGDSTVSYRELDYPMPADRVPRIKQMIFGNELQWVFPARDTAQSGQMAKLEEQEIQNNPTALMQAGADLYDGFE